MAKAKSKPKRRSGPRPRGGGDAGSADVFNRALAIKLQWGPETAIDVRVRIARALPGLGPRRIGALLKDFGAIISSAYAVVYDQLERRQSEGDGRRAVAALDPRLSADNAATLYQQARYSAWRDGLA
jgi:hypothetical protein